MVIKIFIWGMLIGPLAILAEFSIKWLIQPMGLKDFIYSLSLHNWNTFIGIILIAPIVEEFLKYQIVKTKILNNPDFDEPLDAMLYLIIGALGFAAIENLLLVFQNPLRPFDDVLSLVVLRFLSATLVHALASGMLGYWLARSLREPEKRTKMLAKGFGLAIFFHGSYNCLTWFLDPTKGSSAVLMTASMIFILITLMAIAVSYNFSVLKNLHSVCKICSINKKLSQRDQV